MQLQAESKSYFPWLYEKKNITPALPENPNQN